MRGHVAPKPAASSATGLGAFVIGRDRFARISAVEGIALSEDTRAMLQGFDRAGLSADQRRRAILQRFAPARPGDPPPLQ